MRPVLVACLIALCLPRAAAADQVVDGTLSVALEVADRHGKDATDKLTLSLALTGEHGCSKASWRAQSLAYDVEVCRMGGTLTQPVLGVTIERKAFAPGSTEEKRFRVTARMAAGRRAVLGELKLDHDGATEIAATAQPVDDSRS